MILTAIASGAEVIPFIKVWGMLPGAVAGAWIYTRLCRKFSREKVFYFLISGFLTYFLIFAFLIFPNREALHLDSLGNFLSSVLPQGFKGMIAMVRNWTFSTFYIICELWAVMILTVLFWGVVNDLTKVSEAKRSYGILNIGSNIAPVVGGTLAIFCAQNFSIPMFYSGTDAWEQSLINLILLVTVLGCGAMILFRMIQKKILPKIEIPDEERVKKKEKRRLSIRNSLKVISASPYLCSIAMMVLGFNIAINLTDILWKAQLKNFFTNPNDMLAHMNQVTVGIGIFATMGALFFSILVRKLGWTFIALLTPVVMTVMAIGFFVFLFTGSLLETFALSMFGLSPLALTVYFGSTQNCLSKAGKYSVFDASKELAFLPLDAETRLKGKAAIDGLGSGIGKSGASLSYQGILIMAGSVAHSTPYIAIILFVVLGAWLFSVSHLGKRFKALSGVEAAPSPTIQEDAVSEEPALENQ